MLCPSCGQENRESASSCDTCGAPLADAYSTAPPDEPTEIAGDLGATRIVETPSLSFASGRYTVRRLLGEGGQKKVYLVHDEALDRDCALALIKKETMDPDSLSRIRREAQAMARLTHPNIVTIHDIGEDEGTPYIVCEYVPAGDLRQELRSVAGPLPLERVLAIARDLCRALAFAHGQGIIHRDLKPGNVWLSGDGSAKLGDFGLALAVDRSRLTLPETVMGTAAYMAPEQAQGQATDARTDLYALGCLLYELVTGRPPFTGADAMSVISQHVHVAPPPPSDHKPDMPRGLEQVILKLLAKAKEGRPSSAEEVLAELERVEAEATQPSPVPAADAPPAVQPLQRLARVPFVGREQEMASLKAALEEAVSGKGSLRLVTGEPGIGKTRLAQELALYAQLRGRKVLLGRCTEAEGSPPYLPFVEALDTVVGEQRTESLQERLGEDASIVAKLMPQIAARLPDLPPPPQLPPESERYMLFQAVTALLRGIAEESGLLLVLEDLHWADKPSLLLLQHLARQLQGSSLLVVGLYRDVEVDPKHPLSEVLADLRRDHLYERIALTGLPAQDVQTLVSTVSEQEAPEVFARALYQQTEGNPFFVEETLRHLVQEGVIYRSEAGWTSHLTITEMRLPEGVKQVISSRLERLSDGCHSLLRQAAVLGRQFRHGLLAPLLEKDEDELLDLVDEALSALVLEEAPGREAAYSFTHALTRQALLEELTRARRQRLHLRAAEAIQAAYSSTLEEHAAGLAYHLSEAGELADRQKTVHYLTLAGGQAFDAAAFEDALRHYESALSLQPADDRRARADLLFKRGLALRSLARVDDALADWREALDAYEELGDAEGVGRVASDITIQLLWGARYVDGLEISRRGLVALGERVSADRCRLLGAGGNILSMAGSYPAGDGMMAQALAKAQQVGDRRLLGEILMRKAMHHFAYMQSPEAVDAGLGGAELLRSAGDLWNLADGLWVAQMCLVWLGRLDEAATIGEELEPLAARVGHVGALLMERRSSGVREVMLTSDLDRLESFAKADLEGCRSAGLPWISLSYTFVGLVDFYRGRWEEALESFQEAARLEPPGFLAGGDWGSLFLWKAYSGDRDEALAMLAERRNNLPVRGQANTMGAWTMLLRVVEGLYVLGERDQAAELYPLVLEAIDTGNVASIYADRLLQTVAGMAAASGGDWEKAEEHYRTALRQAQDLPIVVAQPGARFWYARMLIDRDGPGDRDKARQLLTEAIAMYRKIGMPKHREMAEALLGEV